MAISVPLIRHILNSGFLETRIVKKPRFCVWGRSKTFNPARNRAFERDMPMPCMARADIVSILIDFFLSDDRSERKSTFRPKIRLNSFTHSAQSVPALMVNSKGVYDTVNGRPDNETMRGAPKKERQSSRLALTIWPKSPSLRTQGARICAGKFEYISRNEELKNYCLSQKVFKETF